MGNEHLILCKQPCTQSLQKGIYAYQMVLHGVTSSHQAVQLTNALLSVKFKNRAASWGIINWPKICQTTYLHGVQRTPVVPDSSGHGLRQL